MMRKKLFTACALAIACSACLLGGTALNGQSKSAVAETVSTSDYAFSFANNVNKTDYDGNHYANFDSLSVNFPSTTSVGGMSYFSFPIGDTINMEDANAAIRIRISEVVPVTANSTWRFAFGKGSAGKIPQASKTVYLEENGTVTAQTAGTNTAVTVAPKNGMFDGYVTLPLSIWLNPTDLTYFQVRTNGKYAKGIWNFGDIEYGTVDASGNFTKTSTLWTPYNQDGSANSYEFAKDSTVTYEVDHKLIKANTFTGTTAKNLWLNSSFETGAATVDRTAYDGMRFYVDNSAGSEKQQFQFYIYASTLTAMTPAHGWRANVGFSYFIPDEDCVAFENSFAYRSCFIPAGFKGEMYVPFTTYTKTTADWGAFQPRVSTETEMPATIMDSYQIYYPHVANKIFGMQSLGLVADDTAYMKEAFETTEAANLTTDRADTVMVQSAAKKDGQFELWTNNKSGVSFTTGNETNGEFLGGGALAVYIENLKGRPFDFQVKTHNSLGEIIVLGGEIAEGRVKLVQEDGSVQTLTMKNGVVTIPANAKGTLVVPYVGASATNTKSTTYNFKYPVKGVFRLLFNAKDTAGSASYLLGKVAVVKDDGTCTEIKIDGTGMSALAATSEDGVYKKNRSNIAYSGIFSWEQLIKPTMTTGASIRLKANTANSGLRFESNYDQEVIAAVNAEIAKGNGQIKSVSYGTLIVPKDYLSDTVVPTFASLSAAGKNYLDVESSGFHSTSTATTAKYWGAIIDVLPSNYEREFVGLGYAKLIMADDSVVYVYADYLETNVRSIATVAQAAYNVRNSTQDSKYEYATNDGDYSPFTKAELEMLNGYIPTSTASYASVVLAEGNANYAATTRKWQGVPGVEVTADNRLWATFFTGGEQEPSDDNYIVVSYSDDNGTTWKEPFFCIGHSGSTVRAYDPSLWIDPQGKLWITWCQANTYSNMKTWAIVIDKPDANETELKEQVQNATPRLLFDGVKLNKFLALSNGDWLAFTASSNPTDITVQASTNQGASWGVRSTVSGGGLKVTEPMAVETENGKLLLLTRIEDTDGEISGGISKATSDDYGKTWTVVQGNLEAPLRGPSSRFALVKLASGNLLLINHNNETYRRHLTAYLSTDGGNTWGDGLLLTGEDTQVSYPDIAQGTDGTIYVIYDRGRYTVKEIDIVLITETNGTLSKGNAISVSNLEDSAA